MTKARTLFAALLLAVGTLTTWAQNNAIAVYQKDGQVAKFAFTEKPVVTYSGSDLVMTTSKTSVQYPIYLLQKIGFEVDDQAFYMNSSLDTGEWLSHITKLGWRVFSSCHFFGPYFENLEEIGSEAFYSCFFGNFELYS